MKSAAIPQSTVKDLPLPNAVSQKDEKSKPPIADLDDIAIPHIKTKNYCSILQYRRLPCPSLKIKHSFFLSFFMLKKVLAFCHNGDDYNYVYDDDVDNGVYI